MTKYINIPQNRTGRLFKGSKLGIFTGNVDSCNIILITGNKDREPCLSLTHADSKTSVERIQVEFTWFTKVDEVIVFFPSGKKMFGDELCKLPVNVSRGYSIRGKVIPEEDVAIQVDWSDRSNGWESRTIAKLPDVSCVVNHPQKGGFIQYEFNIVLNTYDRSNASSFWKSSDSWRNVDTYFIGVWQSH